MYPHERSLVKRLQGRPFVLLGINSDPKERLQQAIQREQMTWQSWWDGGDTHGPIAQAWDVHGWPTMYVLDQKGIIRYKLQGIYGDSSAQVLDEAVDALLQKVR